MPAGRPYTGTSTPGGTVVGGTRAGYKPCTLTWYDPALGGTNSSNGAANPHSVMADREPYDATKYTCAAPPEFPFGEYIRIFVGQKNCQVKVTDRGGAIQTVNGVPHFDLSRAAANTLGIIGSGSAQAQYKKAAVKYAGPGGGPNVGPDLNPADLLGGLTGPLGDIAKVISFIFSLQFLYVVGGGILLLVGLIMLLRTTSAGRTVTDIPGKAAEVAAL